MRIAVLGGAFDPIHNGHLQIAKQALKQLRVDEVWFMPSAATPLKQTQAASFRIVRLWYLLLSGHTGI